jgi:DNA-cytosine methyltransferase
MKILSLFDWMSCWQIAINRLWIKDYIYYASEIDKYTIEVTQHNYPNTIQVWDITSLKWEDFKDIHLIMWGSPCQWFSFAGKQLNFEDERSKLFFEFVRLVKEVKPKYFLLENVKMKKEFQDIISEHLFWIQPTIINSALLTAQNRVRLYWVWELQEDWTYKQVKIEQPEDKGILLKDILEDKVDEKYYITVEQFKNLWFESLQRLYNEKAPTLNTSQWWHRQPKILVNKYNQRVMLEKSWTLWTWAWFTNKQWYQVIEWEHKIRKLTPIEYERLQWVKDNYTSCVSNSQRYKMLGNWWTIPVIEHILKHLIK